MDKEYQPPQLENVASPTLEALYNDLDMFINELSTSNRTSSASNKKYNQEITPLDLNQPLVRFYYFEMQHHLIM